MKRTLNLRDGYILAQALAYAIALDEHLLPHQQEPSNQIDRKALLNQLFGPYEPIVMHDAEKMMNELFTRMEEAAAEAASRQPPTRRVK